MGPQIIRFALEDVADSNGIVVPTLVKYTKIKDSDQPETREEWGNVHDFDSLFNACVSRWGSNWNLEKVIVAIRESEID